MGACNLAAAQSSNRQNMPGDPFQIETPPNAPLRSAALVAARPLLSWLLGLHTYRLLYQRAQGVSGKPFETRALDALDIRAKVSPHEVGAIPKNGPLLIAANHPHGLLDGLLLASAVRQARPDVRILTNHLLSRIPELADLCFFVDPFGGRTAIGRNQAGLRAAHLWLRKGGALIVFPAGEVAHERQADGSYSDSAWLATTGRMVLATGAQVVPAFIAGRNTKLFYSAGRVHRTLRTVLLARELLSKRGQTVSVQFGEPLASKHFSAIDGDALATTRFIRSTVESLADGVASEIANLPGESCLVESGPFQVFCANARQIPIALREIGRLREVTYRAVGEGTGRSVDLDAFDDRYLHLFSWDREKRRLVGAYRIGQTDRIIATHGIEGLYTRTLFRYDERLIARLSPALELGRSFIRAEYQKNYNALLLLWKGIGQFVVRHSAYRILFGPVSISSRYSDSTHRLLMAFLQQNHLDRDLADLVQAINPGALKPIAPFPSAIPQSIPESIEDANRLVAQAEPDGKGLPILLRQYLKLNARLIGFNVDPNFGDALDALMMVDLTAIDSAILNRYLGRQGAIDFVARHRGGQSAHAA